MSVETEIGTPVESVEIPEATPVTPSDVVQTPVEVPTAQTLEAEQTPVVPDEPRDEAERLEPVPTGPVTLLSGQQVDIQPLKLRELLKLLKIVTRGASGALESVMGSGLNLEDPTAFAQTLGALVLFSIPESENEVVEFLQSVVSPVGAKDMDQKARLEVLQKLAEDLYNPELEDVVSIIERVIRRESEDIRSLGKRIGTAFQLGAKVGVVNPVAK